MCYHFAVATPLTTMQAAKKRGVSRPRILALIYEGRLKAQKVGMQYLIKPADLAALKIHKTGRPRNSDRAA